MAMMRSTDLAVCQGVPPWHPLTSAVVTRLGRATQYAAASRLIHDRL